MFVEGEMFSPFLEGDVDEKGEWNLSLVLNKKSPIDLVDENNFLQHCLIIIPFVAVFHTC